MRDSLMITQVMPIAESEMRRASADGSACVVEVHSYCCQDREETLRRLHRAFAASGCWMVEHRRRGRRTVEYSFEVELGAALDLYCGLVQAGLEMTDLSHRALTELCLLGRLQKNPRAAVRLVPLRLSMSFLEVEDAACGEIMIAAWA